MSPYIKIPLKVLTYLIVIAVVAVAMLLVGARLFNVQMYVVLSGSMEPEYPTGSLIYVKEIDPEALQVKDVITFRLTEQTTATHRIIEVVKDDTTGELIGFITKGDANEIADGDEPLDPGKVLGTPVLTIPKLGYFATYIQSPPGSYVAISFGALAILIVVLIDWITDDGEKKKKKAEKQGAALEGAAPSDNPEDESK